MADRTVNAITDAAWGLNGIAAANVESADDTFALDRLIDMLSSWSAKGIVIPYYVTENFTLTTGQAVYTIGLTGDSPDLVSTTGRPIRISQAWIRQSNNDYYIDVNMTKEEYALLVRKDTTQRPTRLWYDRQYPKGKIRFDYESDTTHDFHIIAEKPFDEINTITALTDTLSLPEELNEAMVFNLALRLASNKNNKLSDDVRRIARDSLDTVEELNSIDRLSDINRLDPAITYEIQR
jgi:hypothetical protein